MAVHPATVRHSVDATSYAAPALTNIAEAILKLSGAVAVFGYLSFRAHLNHLGISITRPFGLERYLTEAGELVWYAVTVGGLLLPFAVAVVVLANSDRLVD